MCVFVHVYVHTHANEIASEASPYHIIYYATYVLYVYKIKHFKFGLDIDNSYSMWILLRVISAILASCFIS